MLLSVFILIICNGFFLASAQHRSSTMLPNERTSLDDCHLRYFSLDRWGGNKPANGKPTRFREFAHMAAVGWTNPETGTVRWRCGGSLIWHSPGFVLTAAHCALDARNRAPDIVRLGDLNLYSDEDDQFAQQFGIAQIIRHPEHRFAASYHDVALLRLDGNVTLNETVLPACLWRDQEVRFKRLIATGWGSTGFAKKQTPMMLKVELTPMPAAQCNKAYPPSRKLQQGLQDQHLCAVDKLMDTCEGDSGGPLQVKLMHNSRMTPFVIGVTSFGSSCGTSNPGVYTKVSFFHDWIVASMRTHGAMELNENYNETNCALRFATYREFDKYVVLGEWNDFTTVDPTNARMIPGRYPDKMVQIGWYGVETNCHGVIVDEDTVLTIADCTDVDGKLPSHIVYLNKKVMNISKVIVHPDYTKNIGYNNIAILKMSQLLDVPIGFIPACIYHGMFTGNVDAYGNARHDLSQFLGFYDSSDHDPTHGLYTIKSAVLSEENCVVSERYLSRFPHGLTREQFCVGNDVFLVPGMCNLLTGSIVGVISLYYDVIALTALGRDCGFGEHVIATRLASHVEWMKSVLLPKYQDTLTALRYIDSDLREGDQCVYSHGRSGRCVPLNDCPDPTGSVTFCSINTVVCCPTKLIDHVKRSRIHPDIYKCPDLADNQNRINYDGSMVLISWMPELRHKYGCSGVFIAKSTILTTASCLEGKAPYLVYPTNNEEAYVVTSFLIHAAYNETDNTNDLAIVKLRNPVSWSADLYPACLWTNVTHTPIVLDLLYSETIDETFHTTVFPMYNSDCQRTHRYRLADSQLCTRHPSRNVTCESNADMLFWWNQNGVPFLVGLAANDDECDNWRYMINTRLSSFLEWISENAFTVMIRNPDT